MDAGLEDYDPNEVPPATDVAPEPVDIRDTEAYEAPRAELIREIDKGEFRYPSPRNPFPPTRYEDD